MYRIRDRVNHTRYITPSPTDMSEQSSPPNEHPVHKHHSVCRFSQFLNFESSSPKIHVNICLAFMLARITPRLLYQWWVWLPLPPLPPPYPSSCSTCFFFSRIWVSMPTSSSSTLWLMPTDISMYFTRNVQAKHLPSANEQAEKKKLH